MERIIISAKEFIGGLTQNIEDFEHKLESINSAKASPSSPPVKVEEPPVKIPKKYKSHYMKTLNQETAPYEFVPKNDPTIASKL